MNIAPFTLALVAALGFEGAAHADCIDQAAQHHGVNAQVLRAIGWHESRLRPQALGHNANGSVDIGAFQINSTHLGTLAAYGVTAQSLKDGCVSAYVGAWHYRRQVLAFGDTWQAVGAYHSRTPARSAWYANAVASVLMDWGVMPRGALPFDTATTLAPGQNRPGHMARPQVASAAPRRTPVQPMEVVYDDGGAAGSDRASPQPATADALASR